MPLLLTSCPHPVTTMNITVELNSILQTCFFKSKTNSNIRRRRNLSLLAHLPTNSQVAVVVGGGPAGIYAAVWAKTVAPTLTVVLVEKGQPLSKVKISGGGRCNVTTGQFADNMNMAENYPRGHKELRGSFFSMHSPTDTISWFTDHGVKLKTESDGRVFPVSNSSSSVIDCLMNEVKQRGVSVQTGKSVSSAAKNASGKFVIKIVKRNSDSIDLVEADYLLLATGNNLQGYNLAGQLGHSIVDPVPSLFTFKIKDPGLAELSGVTFSKVKAKLKLENGGRNVPQLTQVGPMLVTHWGLSGPVILRLSAWSARNLFSSQYKGILIVDFAPDLQSEKAKSILLNHKKLFTKQKVVNSSPTEFGVVKRFWKYLLYREGIADDMLWASISSNALIGIASLLKQCVFEVTGKGQFKDEFVTAGGVPLSEVSLNTMESKMHSNLFFAGEILNIDGVTGGYNFQEPHRRMGCKVVAEWIGKNNSEAMDYNLQMLGLVDILLAQPSETKHRAEPSCWILEEVSSYFQVQTNNLRDTSWEVVRYLRSHSLILGLLSFMGVLRIWSG